MDDRLSVGLVSPGWPPESFSNGIVTYVATLAPELRSAGHSVSILAAATAPGFVTGEAWTTERAARSVPRRLLDGLSHRVSPRRAARSMAGRALARAARRMCGERPIDLIEMEETLGLSLWVRRSVGVPLCVRLHGPWFLNGPAVGAADDGMFRDRVRWEGEAIRAADGINAPSQDVLDRVRARYDLPLPGAEVIPYPIRIPHESRHWRLDSCDPNRILFVGRFDRHKGGDVIVEAFRRLASRHPRARLTMAGPDTGLVADDGRRWSLAEFVGERMPGALESGRVEWLGAQAPAALAELRLSAMVSVVPSRYETFGYTVTEALAAGCPLVAARTGGIPEIVTDGWNGLLHAAADAEDLAAKLDQVLTNGAAAAERGARAAADTARRFSPRAIAERLADFYRQTLDRMPARRRRGV